MCHYAINTKVKWPWGNGCGEGYIRRKYTERVTKKLNGTEVTRDADKNYPAYLIEHTDGSMVLKTASEICKAN
ncbi:HVA1 family protein [Alteromonas flava]|uniref:HVA1 family protein n=1 Tax=Alteromonas flava TaxID=2048003 RepID=UPI000C290785|nr:HVA1 family protein [Alteromonas flava]